MEQEKHRAPIVFNPIPSLIPMDLNRIHEASKITDPPCVAPDPNPKLDVPKQNTWSRQNLTESLVCTSL